MLFTKIGAGVGLIVALCSILIGVLECIFNLHHYSYTFLGVSQLGLGFILGGIILLMMAVRVLLKSGVPDDSGSR
jgi:hypothetical protein